jgi:hypothetical protein
MDPQTTADRLELTHKAIEAINNIIVHDWCVDGRPKVFDVPSQYLETLDYLLGELIMDS